MRLVCWANQSPPTKGVRFPTLEDEYGFQQYYRVTQGFVRFPSMFKGVSPPLVKGQIQREGAVTNVIAYRVPKTVQFVDSLPRNAAGKILKRELRNRV